MPPPLQKAGLPRLQGSLEPDIVRDAKKLQKDLGRADLPIIVYTGKELTRKEEAQLKRVAASIIIKEADSPERLLAETALFLHRIEANLPEPKRRMLERVKRKAGKSGKAAT